MTKNTKVRSPGLGPFAHGAVKPTRFQKREQGGIEVAFGATVCGEDDYPVRFYKLRDIERLHAWLGKVIEYAKQS